MLFTFACLTTGEFPPKKDSVKAQYQTFLDLKSNAAPLLKLVTEKLKANKQNQPLADQLLPQGSIDPESINDLLKQGSAFGAFPSKGLEEVRQEQVRLKIQLDLIIQQNNEILKRLNK